MLTTKPLEDVVQGHSNQVKDLIEANQYNTIYKSTGTIDKSNHSGITYTDARLSLPQACFYT